MGAYSDSKKEYHKSRIRDIMIQKPDVTIEGVKLSLEQAILEPISLDRQYIKKLMEKIRKDRLLRLDRAEIKERLSVMRETTNLVAAQMWNILNNEDLNLMKGGLAARVAAGRVIIDGQKNLLESEMNAGVFDRKLGTIALEAGGMIQHEHVHQLDPAVKSQLIKAFENYGIIRKVNYVIADGERSPDSA